MRSRSLSLAIVLLCAGSVRADPAVDALLVKMRAAYGALKSAKMAVSTKVWRPSGELLQFQGHVSFQSPAKVFADFRQLDGPRTILRSDGTLIQAGDPSALKRHAFSVRFLETALPVNLEVINLWDWRRQLSTAKGGNMNLSKLRVIPRLAWNGENYIVLEETAKAQNLLVRYYVSPNDYLIRRTYLQNLSTRKTRMDVWLTRLLVNPELPASLFKLAPLPIHDP